MTRVGVLLVQHQGVQPMVVFYGIYDKTSGRAYMACTEMAWIFREEARCSIA